jgi:iron complex outermembrane receptor protein
MHLGRASSRQGIRFLVPLAIFFVTAVPAAGGAPEESGGQRQAGQEESPAEDTASTYEEQIEVLADRPTIHRDELELEELQTGRAPNVSVALVKLTGISGVQRSLNSYEPVIHGLGWERVQTQVNGMPLYGACPARMDPPSFLISSSVAQEVAVTKGLSSVTLGPGGTGGRVDVSIDNDRGSAAGREIKPWFEAAYHGANDGLQSSAGAKGGTRRFDYVFGVEHLDQGDYTSASGTVVPAGQKETGGFFTFGHRAGDAHRWTLGTVFQGGEAIAYPSLPMDTDDADTSIFSVGYRYEPEARRGSLASLEVFLGLSQLDHRMSNRYRTNRMGMQAETASEAGTLSARVNTRWHVSPRSVVSGGIDWNALERDALRQRHVTATDQTFFDRLWPEISQDDVGLFAEYGLIPRSGWHLRFGLRYDDVRSAAGAADDPALGGGTIRDAYVRFYGPDAAVTDRDEGLVTGNVVFSKYLGKAVTLQGGVGLVSRAAGATERYFAFAPAPNGFLVGNPTLDAERKGELSLGATFDRETWKGSVSGYYYSVDDYILPVIVDEIDMDSNGTLDLIRGFENTEATLIGLDLDFLVRPSDRWTVPISLFCVRGEDETRQLPLPEIPPLELRLAVRRSFSERPSGWVELGGRFVAEQDRIDPAYPENETPGFAVWHLRARIQVARFLTIEARAENLFDREYWEHLTREAAGNVPGLAPGQEIPQPGRFASVALLFAF